MPFDSMNYKYMTAVILTLCAGVLAVSPVVTVHDSQADFAASGKAEMDRVAAFSGGEVLLSNSVKDIPFKIDGVDAVTVVAIGSDGRIYAGSATRAIVFSLDGDGGEDQKAEKLADLDGVLVTDMVFHDDDLYVATAGEGCGVFRIGCDGDKRGEVEKIFSDDRADSVWAIAFDGRDVFAATGGDGLLFRISPGDDDIKVVFDAEQDVLRSLVISDKKLYVGTGGDGLVYLLDMNAELGKDGFLPSRVVLDAEESEIVALAIAGDGTLLAAGSSVTSSKPEAPAKSDTGRADTQSQPNQESVAGDDIEDGATESQTDHSQQTEKNTDVNPAPPAPDKSDAKPEKKMLAQIPGVASGSPSGKNNVYLVDTNGFIRIAGSVSRTVYDMAFSSVNGPRIYLACDGGGIHRIDPVAGISADIAKLDCKKPFSLGCAPDGSVYVAGVAPASLKVLSASAAKTGLMISEVIDAGQISAWTAVYVRAAVPEGASVELSISTGNTSEPDDKTWSHWSPPVKVINSWTPVSVPSGRFCRYRLKLAAAEGHSGNAPVVDRVSILRQTKNLRPEIKSIETARSDKPEELKPKAEGPLRFRFIKVEATDPNSDTLRYDYYFRRVGTKVWVLWKEDSSQTKLAWDASGVPDGEYEIRVVACDSTSNPPAAALTEQRISRVLTVDNTPPSVVSLELKQTPELVRLVGSFKDMNRIVSVRYRLDSDEVEVEIPAADGVFDLCEESVDVLMDSYADLKAGAHVLSLEVTDEFGNAAYESLEFTK